MKRTANPSDTVYVVVAQSVTGTGTSEVWIATPGVFFNKEEAQRAVRTLTSQGIIAWYVDAVVGSFREAGEE